LNEDENDSKFCKKVKYEKDSTVIIKGRT